MDVLLKTLLVMVLSTIVPISINAQTDPGGSQSKTRNGRKVTLTLSKAPEQTDSVWLEVKVGSFPKGTELEIWTVEGRFLGTISPFGNPSRDVKDTSVYSVPIPRDAITDKRLELRLIINTGNNTERAPTKKDVRSAKLKITSANTRP